MSSRDDRFRAGAPAAGAGDRGGRAQGAVLAVSYEPHRAADECAKPAPLLRPHRNGSESTRTAWGER